MWIKIERQKWCRAKSTEFLKISLRHFLFTTLFQSTLRPVFSVMPILRKTQICDAIYLVLNLRYEIIYFLKKSQCGTNSPLCRGSHSLKIIFHFKQKKLNTASSKNMAFSRYLQKPTWIWTYQNNPKNLWRLRCALTVKNSINRLVLCGK